MSGRTSQVKAASTVQDHGISSTSLGTACMSIKPSDVTARCSGVYAPVGITNLTEESCTLTALKPGSSKAKSVGHRLCRRGWLLLLPLKTGSTVCRCCSEKKAAAAAAASLGVSDTVKKSVEGDWTLDGSRLVCFNRVNGIDPHRRSASNSTCRSTFHVHVNH